MYILMIIACFILIGGCAVRFVIAMGDNDMSLAMWRALEILALGVLFYNLF